MSSDGREVGDVETPSPSHADVFDGLIVDLRAGPGGHRFADAELVEGIYERGVVLAMTRRPPGASRSRPESRHPRGRPEETAPEELRDKLRRAWDYLSGNY